MRCSATVALRPVLPLPKTSLRTSWWSHHWLPFLGPRLRLGAVLYFIHVMPEALGLVLPVGSHPQAARTPEGLVHQLSVMSTSLISTAGVASLISRSLSASISWSQ